MSPTTEKRSIFDWLVFIIIHIVLIGAIGYAGFAVYGPRLGGWVAASAFIAGMVSLYLFAKIVPGETLMKVWLGLCVALNAGYIVHNGARAIGIEAFNNAQVKKFEIGMAQAAQSQSRSIARALGASAKDAAALEKVFDDGVSLIAAILAFLELASAVVIFSIASKRVAAIDQQSATASAGKLYRYGPDGKLVEVAENVSESDARQIAIAAAVREAMAKSASENAGQGTAVTAPRQTPGFVTAQADTDPK